MIFDFFRKSSTTRHQDKIWLSRAQKYRGICREVEQLQQVRPIVVLLAFFRRSWTELGEQLTKSGLHHLPHQETLSPPALLSLFNRTPEGGVSLVLAEATSDLAYGNAPHAPAPAVPRHLIVLEHYPLRARDEALERAAAALPFPHHLTFHGALDEPLFQQHGAERIVPMWKSLGLAEDGCLESEPVSQALASAQKAIGRQVRSEIRADSAEDWFARNLDDHPRSA